MNEGVLKFLGNDAGFGEKNNSAYIEYNNKLMIIDCGFTVFNIVKNKFDFKKYDEIELVITHLHNDHAGSLSQLVLYLFFVLNIKPVVISACENIKKYLEITGTPDDAYDLKDELENLKFIKTEHTIYLDAYGFKFNLNGKTIIYTGDSSCIDSFENDLIKADEFYVDLSKNGGAHNKVDDIIDKLVQIKNNGTKIIPMHMDDKEYINNVLNNHLT